MEQEQSSKSLSGSSKWKLLGITLIIVIVMSTILSLVTRVTLVEDDPETRPRIAVVGPMKSTAGKELMRGASLSIQKINAAGGWNGRPIEMMVLEEDAQASAEIIKNGRVVAAVGFLDHELLEKAEPALKESGIPVVTPLYLEEKSGGWAKGMGFSPAEEARFIANYARNIKKQRIMYVIRSEDAKYDQVVEPFVETYKRFDTPVRDVFLVSDDLNAGLSEITKKIKSIDFGAVYLAMDPKVAARMVHLIRSSGNPLEVFGSSNMTTSSFQFALSTYSGKNINLLSHGVIAATPVLFDTANNESQRFQTLYQQTYEDTPGWMATLSHDAVSIVLGLKSGNHVAHGLTGQYPLNAPLSLPIQVGVYNGQNLISAPIQLSPLAKGVNFNYVDALRQGRVLYVNDRFMFKTNVVYTGFTLHEISEMDRQDETALLDMSIWFRYQGKFSPETMEVANAVEPVTFDNLEESKDSDGIRYRRYRIKQRFKLNFTQDERAYSNHIAGISFRHQTLNRNNLSYVVDVLGMPTGKAMLSDLIKRRIARPGAGWQVNNAWVSQKVVRERGNGAPQYVGMTGEQPLYSKITLGVLLKPDTIVVRDFIPSEFFIYIAIFGFIGSLAAWLTDRKQLGSYWMLNSMVLRIIFWPLFVLAVGNLLVDWSFANWPRGLTQTLVLGYDSLWWLIGARMSDMFIRRFIWVPLENKARRPIPNVMKMLATFVIFSLAVAGITAFVFNETLTSLLATSGVLAMVVGFAVQANIANVFSGIILNVERPFQVGDYIKVDNVFGQVSDITWRTVRILSYEGPVVSLTNAKVSESKVENHNDVPKGLRMELNFHIDADVEPEVIENIIGELVEGADYIMGKGNPKRPAHQIQFVGIENVNGKWVAAYVMRFKVSNFLAKIQAKGEFWLALRLKLKEKNIPLLPTNNLYGAAVTTEAPNS
ncbi:mechanosensitive ion channel domain-containing protein [Magnetococcus sp. PR-3]|uniref:mechanosensitive ion channel domain-containing protein n=1 Tax=Magnetococcus sp. PR-3 TaxID=3120355 RepID=UPI002FCE1701